MKHFFASLLFSCFALFLATPAHSQTVSPAEKSAFIAVADLRAAGYSHPKWPQGKYSKTPNSNGTFELEYEAETPDSLRSAPLYLSNILAQHQNALVAKENVDLTRTVFTGMFKSQGFVEKSVPKQLIYGDSSRLTTLSSEGIVAGNIFSARKKGRTFLLMLIGVSFEDAKSWDAFAGRKIRAWLSAAK